MSWVEMGDHWTQSSAGHGLNMIQVDGTVSRHFLGFSEEDFGGNEW